MSARRSIDEFRPLRQAVLGRERAAGALRRERDRTGRYLDAAEVMLLAVDPAGRITMANRYAATLLGWRAEELLGLAWVTADQSGHGVPAQALHFRIARPEARAGHRPAGSRP